MVQREYFIYYLISRENCGETFRNFTNIPCMKFLNILIYISGIHTLIFTYIARLPLDNSVKIFDIEFLPGLFVLRSTGSKKVIFENWSVYLYA